MAGTLTIGISKDLLKALKMTPDEFDHEARLSIAARLYALGKVSSGRAAQICGMGRVEFLMALNELGVAAVNLDEADAAAELNFDKS